MEANTQLTTVQQVTDLELTKYLNAMGLTSNLNEKETLQFLQIAKAYNLNPFKREIYCTKYGSTFSIIVGYESYIKRAERSGLLNGWKTETIGSGLDLKAIVTIYRKDFAMPFVHEVHFSEYVQNKSDGTPNVFWKTKPVTMIKKVAISQAFRMCFSSEIGGMPYTAEEIVENETIYTEATEIKDTEIALKEINECITVEQLQACWSHYKDFQTDVDFINAKEAMKVKLTPKN